jgi:hypothetical protein
MDVYIERLDPAFGTTHKGLPPSILNIRASIMTKHNEDYANLPPW